MIEGGGDSGMMLKEVGASFLSMFPGNKDLQRAFELLPCRAKPTITSREAPRVLRDLGADWRSGEAATSCVDAVTASRRLGQLQGDDAIGDPLEGVDEQRARSRR